MFSDIRKCPSCSITGKKINENPIAFICPSCLTSFGKFGIIASTGEEERECN